MADFRVTWEADVVAENPEAAARYARAMQTRRGSIATVFEVFEEGQEPVTVDLTELEQGQPVSEVDAALGFSTEPKPLGLSSRELATVLHGLRLIQENANGPGDCVAGGCDHFGQVDELQDGEIDSLCERLNSGEPASTPANFLDRLVEVFPWLVQGVEEVSPADTVNDLQQLYYSLTASEPAIKPTREEAAEAAQVAKVVTEAKCPKCGEVNAIEQFTDAWEKQQVLGFDKDGKLVKSTLTDTWTGDDSHFECTECGETIDEDEIEESDQP